MESKENKREIKGVCRTFSKIIAEFPTLDYATIIMGSEIRPRNISEIRSRFMKSLNEVGDTPVITGNLSLLTSYKSFIDFF